jgi:hypothetical protein
MMEEIRNGQDPGLNAPVLSAVTPSGESVVPGQQEPEPFPYWVIGIAVGGAILVAAIIIVVVLIVRKRKGYGYSSTHPYTKMQTF